MKPNNGNPPPEAENAVIEYFDGFIYVAAGKANPYLTGFFRYNLFTSLWEDISNPSQTYTSRSSAQSAIINETFYLIYGLGPDKKNSNIMKVNLNSSIFARETLQTTDLFSRNSFASTTKNSEIFLFGGFSNSAYIPENDLVKFDFLTYKFEIISKSQTSPLARSSHSMQIIQANAFIFGGLGLHVFYNDMWTYNFELDTWKFVNSFGKVPLGRHKFASDSQGDAIIVWGGEGVSGLFDDFFIFNVRTSTWTELLPSSSVFPSGAKATCVKISMPFVYIYGGITTSGYSGELWEYDIGTYKFTLLSTGPKLAYITCELSSSYFYVVFGENPDGHPQNSIHRFDLELAKWEKFFSGDNPLQENTIQGVQFFFDGVVIRISGIDSEKNPEKKIFVISNKEFIEIGEITETFYLSGFAYYNTSLYVFGGGSILSQLLLTAVPSNLFVKIDIKDICANGVCQALCSAGTMLIDGTCRRTIYGTYSEGIGNENIIECPKGTYNDIEGASSSRQCYPCPEGYYSEKTGASHCLQCLTGFFCPIGSTSPKKLFFLSENNSIQPDLYLPQNPNPLIFKFELSVGLAMSFCIFLAICWAKANSQVKKIDLFISEHNYELKKKMILNKTTVGGIFTLAFVMFSMYLFGIATITYFISNVQETKALVPLVILESEVSDFISSDFFVFLTLLNYGDSCVTSEKNCSVMIMQNLKNIRSEKIIFQCELSEDKSCILTVHCVNCIIDTGATLEFLLKEELNYTTGVYVNVTTDSSIPGKVSSVVERLYPSSGYMLIGSIASEFFITATPSLFLSESSEWPDKATDTTYQ